MEKPWTVKSEFALIDAITRRYPKRKLFSLSHKNYWLKAYIRALDYRHLDFEEGEMGEDAKTLLKAHCRRRMAL